MQWLDTQTEPQGFGIPALAFAAPLVQPSLRRQDPGSLPMGSAAPAMPPPVPGYRQPPRGISCSGDAVAWHTGRATGLCQPRYGTLSTICAAELAATGSRQPPCGISCSGDSVAWHTGSATGLWQLCYGDCTTVGATDLAATELPQPPCEISCSCDAVACHPGRATGLWQLR